MEKVTHDTLPTAISELHYKMDLLLSKMEISQKYQEQDRLLRIEQLIDYLPEHPARQTIYGWVNDRRVPYEKHGKRLYFKKFEIDTWLDNGRRMK